MLTCANQLIPKSHQAMNHSPFLIPPPTSPFLARHTKTAADRSTQDINGTRSLNVSLCHEGENSKYGIVIQKLSNKPLRTASKESSLLVK